MPTSEKSSLRTAVYIDGYNLYYGRLRGTPFKWLDVVQLFDSLLVHRDQNERLERVHFFTAPALANFASHGQSSGEAQSAYHRALQTLHGDRIELIYGKHTFDKDGALLPVYVAGQPYDRNSRVRVWKLEEKQTDVNLAIRMYRDVCKSRYDRVIVVSNDSDVEPALRAIRDDFPHIMIGVVATIRPPQAGNTARRPSGSLSNIADWTLSSISDEQLHNAQLPKVVPTRKKAIRKPTHW